MPIPDFQTLMLPVLKLATSEIKTKDAIEQLSVEFKLSEEEKTAKLPSGRQATMANRVYWAFVYLSKAGLINRVQRGTYVATDDGRKVLAKPPARVDNKYLAQFPNIMNFANNPRPRLQNRCRIPARN